GDFGGGVVADACLHGHADLGASGLYDVDDFLAALGAYGAVGHEQGVGALVNDVGGGGAHAGAQGAARGLGVEGDGGQVADDALLDGGYGGDEGDGAGVGLAGEGVEGQVDGLARL